MRPLALLAALGTLAACATVPADGERFRYRRCTRPKV